MAMLRILLRLSFIANFIFNIAQSIEVIIYRSIKFNITENFQVNYYYTRTLQETNNALKNLDDPKILFDFSPSIIEHYQLSSLCEELGVIHFVTDGSLDYFSNLAFSLSTSYKNYLSSIVSLLKYFNWSQGLIFNSYSYEFIEESLFAYSSSFKKIRVSSDSSIEDAVQKIAAPSGAQLYYIFTDNDNSLSIQTSLLSTKLIHTGDGILIGKDSYFEAIIEGALIIAEEGQEWSYSQEDYLSNSVSFIMSLLLSKEISIMTNYQLANILHSVCEHRFCKSSFSLVNIWNGERIIVGSLNSSHISIEKKIFFPGNSTSIPISTKKVLNLSINGGPSNPAPSPPNYDVPLYARGSFMAVSMINRDSEILENFELNLFDFDCGATSYNAIAGAACFTKDIDHFGLAHISSYSSSVVISQLKTFKSLNITIPIVGSTSSAISLNSTAIYPSFIRVALTDAFLASEIPTLLRALGWKKCAVLYQNEAWGQSAYSKVKEVAEQGGVEILNDPEYRVIPPGLTRDQVASYTHILQGILETKARLVLAFMYSNLMSYVFEKFYDLGARKGDLVIVSTLATAPADIGFNDSLLYKRLEIGVPMMVFQGSVWVGEFGQKVYNNLQKTYMTTPRTFACNFFDSAWFIASALDWMINRGQDYTDASKLNNTIRSIGITGCLGKIRMVKGTNDREMTTMDISSNDIVNGTIQIYRVGTFSPYGTHYLAINQPVIYGDNSTTKPSDLRLIDGSCPFPDKDIRTFSDGRIVVFAICFALGTITAVITFFIWKKWWNVKIENLTVKQEISIQDFVVGATIAVEFFQFASMGPDYRPINTFLAEIGDLLSLNLSSAIVFENNLYWIFFDIILALCFFWIVLCFIILFRLDEKLSSLFLFRFLGQLGDWFMPVLGNLCFIPFVSILLDIFVCDQSIGNNFSDSFLAKDCNQFCWQGSHIIYVILSILALLTYEPLAVFCRPLWQEFQSQLHVKTSPTFLMVKTGVQISLIVMNKTVKRAQATAHGFLFVLILALYDIFIFKKYPYNYPRFSWWQFISIIGVAWLSFLSTMNLLIGDNEAFYWVVLVFLGWINLCGIGLYVQWKKYPSLLFRPKGNDQSILFDFAFRFGKAAEKSIIRLNSSKKRTNPPESQRSFVMPVHNKENG
ncbi:unnamed protein product [Blepharisma stoltei]|uniref:Receptor ligand binding region domain-containing protein n=1 Tax=Blepharisma stoltei TaxID=1481888 RepID=A0AAU9JTQ7_9CILI|nr:unnamed protein product [Blepharisma stoltei]